MFYSFSLTPFIFLIFFHHFLIPFSNANPSIEDNMLIAFLKGDQETKMSEYLVKKYEAHLGILYYMKNNWHCDQIADEFKEFERTKCQKYRKYLDILYEYLSREYAEIPTVKPKFVFKRGIKINGPIIYAVNCLVRISQFYFRSFCSKNNKYKLNELFYFHYYFEPKLMNEERLNYEPKLENEKEKPINELILQLAIDTANEWQTNESLEEIIRQKFTKIFEENLEEMFKQAEESAITDIPFNIIPITNIDEYKIIVGTKFDDQLIWTQDALFSEFVKGLATNFEKFFKMANEYSIYLHRKKENGNIHWSDENGKMITFGLYEIEKMKKHFTQKYEARLGLMYLMRENWYCERIAMKLNETGREECQKWRKYLDILYEYLFRLYIEGESADLANKFPAVKPIFMTHLNRSKKIKLIEVIEGLNDISFNFWKRIWFHSILLFLRNEVDLNYEFKEENKFKQNISEINGPKNVQKKGNLSNKIEENLRQEFEQKMKKMYQNTIKNAKEEKKKLGGAIVNAANLKTEYNDKFAHFSLSPFIFGI